MSLVQNEKPRTELDLDVFEVNAALDKKFQPFFNVFHHKGVNIIEQRIGELFGVIHVIDDSENSAYLPNLLSQVIKKEFFSDHRRPTEKAFEAALHKANVALTDLAQHEIVEWMGKLQAVIGVMEKNEFHFTQAGGGRILLLRNQLISDLSRGLDDGSGVGHPIKTFSNISSGKIISGDKILFCTETVFDSFSWEDLKRHYNTFSSAEFDNLFRSTLMAEAQQAGAIVVNVNEKIIQPILPKSEIGLEELSIPNQNFFGADGLNRPQAKKNPASLLAPPHHQHSSNRIKEKAKAFLPNHPVKTAFPLGTSNGKTPSPSQSSPLTSPNQPTHSRSVIYMKETDEPALPEAENSSSKNSKIKIWLSDGIVFIKENWPTARKKIRKVAVKTAHVGQKIWSTILKILHIIFAKIEAFRLRRRIQEEQESISKPITATLTANPNLNQPKANQALSIGSSLGKIRHIIIAIASRTIKIWSRMDRKKKIILTGIILVIGMTFLILNRSKRSADDQLMEGSSSPSALPTDQSDNQPVDSSELSMIALAKIDQPAIQLVGLEKNLFIMSEGDKFFRYDQAEKKLSAIPLPDGFDKIVNIARMDDLNMVFLVSEEAIFSYSPVTNKFQPNTISLPSGMQIKGADAYMTFLYLIDQNGNQIYRYPRSGSGFGEKKDWLKNPSDLPATIDFSVDESIYIITQEHQVKKFSQNLPDPTFSMNTSEQTQPTRVYSDKESSFIFLLDPTNAKLIKADKNGTVLEEKIDTRLLSAKDLWIDQENKTGYLIDQDNQLLSFALGN